MKFLIATLLAISAMSVLARERVLDPKRDGQAAFDAGRYTDAYKIWWPQVAMGADREVQESIALLMFSDKPLRVRFNGQRKVIALEFLYRSALNGQVSAMRRLEAASSNGQLGLLRDDGASQCWRTAAEGGKPSIECAAVTKFKNAASRAKCDQLAFMEEQFAPIKLGGRKVAQRCIANQTLGVMIVMLPPTRRYEEVLTRVYGRYSLEWISVGDAIDEETGTYVDAFNTEMAIEIQRRHGPDIFKRISKEVGAGMGQPPQ